MKCSLYVDAIDPKLHSETCKNSGKTLREFGTVFLLP